MQNSLGTRFEHAKFSEDTTKSSFDGLKSPDFSRNVFRSAAVSFSLDWDNVVSQLDVFQKITKVSRSKEDWLLGETRHSGHVKIEQPAHVFPTDSSYTGQWNGVGMSGFGTFNFPHDVEYEGNMRDGMFHGEGTLTYPMGQKIDGQWVKGKLISFKFRFADGLEYHVPWKYCKMPDRRFYTSVQEGLRPAGRSLLTNDDPPREIPKGCYDTGDGFYNPVTKCVWSAHKPNKVIRVPTTAEEKWIMENCRKAWDEPTGYRPDLYEHWVTGRRTDSVFLKTEDERNDNVDVEPDQASYDDANINMIVPPTYTTSPSSSFTGWESDCNFKMSSKTTSKTI